MKLHLIYFILLLLKISSCPCLGVEQVVILGSGPSGLTSAIYTSRAGLSTLLIEGNERYGQIASSPWVENFPGFPEGISGFQLGENMRSQALRFGTQIAQGRVIHTDLSERPFLLTLQDGQKIKAETLIIATGSSPRWLGLDSEQALLGKGVSTCAVCDAYFFRGQEVLVVGGGDSALEDALFLANFASRVTVVHRRDKLRASPFLQKKALAHEKIRFILNATVESIGDLSKGKVTHVILNHLLENGQKLHPCQGVFIAIGHLPNTALFEGQLTLDEAGHIQTYGDSTATSIPGVFAAGDVADPTYRQAITAAASGCRAALDAYHFLQKEP